MLKQKKSKADGSSGALKKKALVCSTEAAAISIGLHVLLILFAGSIVAIRYVQKRDAAFKGENVSRPKLERRQLQMPVKVKNLQKKSTRPKVTTRMASVSQASFSLPDTFGMGTDIGSGFDRGGGADRSLSNMGAAGSLGFGTSSVNFFGAKSKGEKMVFIIDADKLMVEDRRGGYFTYQFAKRRLMEMIDTMRSATLFNVMVYVRNECVMFSPKLVPATPENREAVKKWIEPLNRSPSVVARLDSLPGKYEPPYEYEESGPMQQLLFWMRPVQAAMEQKADNIFVLCSGFLYAFPSTEEILADKGLESEEKWLASQGWGPEKLSQWERDWQNWLNKARKQLADENRERSKQGKPSKVVADWRYYMRYELKWPIPDDRPRLYQTYYPTGYPADWVLEHLEAVYEFNYVPAKLKKPAIHFVKLIASDGTPIDPPGTEWPAARFVNLKKIPRAYKGRFELLQGAETEEDLLKNNDLAIE